MTTTSEKEFKQWILNIADYLHRGEVPPAHYYSTFIQEIDFSVNLVDFISSLDEDEPEAKHGNYSAAVFAMDIYVSQLQILIEAKNKQALKQLNQLMTKLTDAISTSNHTLSFWLPILNAFYEVHVELSPELKDAYLELIDQEEPATPQEEGEKLNAIRNLIEELSDLSVFDIAENFFAQSYAMPPIFFPDLVYDLYSIEEGHDIALLTLLHPNAEARGHIITAIDAIIDEITFSSISLTRLQSIKSWYPAQMQEKFTKWIKIQRKKGVVFSKIRPSPVIKIQASEVDGGGAQGIFILTKEHRKNRLLSLLFKNEYGIKDAWTTPPILAKEVKNYYAEAFDDNISLREIDLDYLTLFVNHFLAVTIESGAIPGLHFLEIEELLGIQFIPQKINIVETLEKLATNIHPFTPERMEETFSRTKSWTKTKSFTESWFIENQDVDRLVNSCSSFTDGTKICMLEDAVDRLFKDFMEKQRPHWIFHFLWVALWAKSHSRKNEKTWEDSLLIAYAIHHNTPLKDIPIMQEICRQTIINSIETMQERKTYLA